MTGTQPSKPIWEAKGSEKRAAVQGMFAEIAPSYDRVNGLMSLNLHQKWRRLAVSKLNLNPGDSALDLCCGTGDFLPLLRQKVGSGGHLLGMDFCPPMLQQSVLKDSKAILSVADACDLPVTDNSLDAITVGWGIRNVPDIDRAHQEIFRVLKSGGMFASVDCAMPTNPIFRFFTQLFRKRLLVTLGAMFKHKNAYTYLEESTVRFKTRQELVDSMRQAGFTDIQFKDLFFGNICLHWGKKP